MGDEEYLMMTKRSQSCNSFLFFILFFYNTLFFLVYMRVGGNSIYTNVILQNIKKYRISALSLQSTNNMKYQVNLPLINFYRTMLLI